MSRSGSQTSQVGLFSTQISEQIVRLRALASIDAAGTDSVSVKRAVMATRLLGGSARILQLGALQDFLDELLLWLQGVEHANDDLNTTQTLILDSVIELEESLMLQLDDTDGEAPDFSMLEDEIRELLQLMKRNRGPVTQRLDPELIDPLAPPTAREVAADTHAAVESVVDLVETAADPASKPTERRSDERGERAEPTNPVTEAAPVVEAKPTAEAKLPADAKPTAEATPVAKAKATDSPTTMSGQAGVVAEHLAAAMDSLDGADGTFTAAELMALGELGRRVHTVLGQLEPMPIEEVAEDDYDADDPLFAKLAKHVASLSVAQEDPVAFRSRGSSDGVGAGLLDPVRDILQSLITDSGRAIDQALREEETLSGGAWIEISVAENDGRLELAVRDNAPRMEGPSLDTGDRLSVYRGLRRARQLLQQLGGVVLVEPQERKNDRFCLMLPAALGRQTYQLISINDALVAVSWALVENAVSTAGLLFETDIHGESIVHHGRNTPLVELSQFTPATDPIHETAQCILVSGSVEKRVGLYCSEVRERVEVSELFDPSDDWAGVAYAAFQYGEQTVPVLDIQRLLMLRFDANVDGAVPGSVNDPVLDAYIPSDLAAPVDTFEDEVPDDDGSRRVLLINQSDFRRREMKRVLEGMGFVVVATDTIDNALAMAPAKLDLIITDLRLGQAARESVPTLRTQMGEPPVVLTSAASHEQAQILARKVGAQAFWLDPYRPDALDRILEAVS